jgi:hypothetical protein
MAWDDSTPSWQRQDTWLRNFALGVEAGQSAVLVPLRVQQAQNALKMQALDLANQGLAGRAASMKLDFDIETMPDRVAELKDNRSIAAMKLQEMRNEQSAWEKEEGSLRAWMELPWEQRIKAKAPNVTSTKGLKVFMDQERLDANSALAKERHQAEINKTKTEARDLAERNRFMRDMASAGLGADDTTALNMTLHQGLPTEASWEMLSNLKARKAERLASEKEKAAEARASKAEEGRQSRFETKESNQVKRDLRKRVEDLRTKAYEAADPGLKRDLFKQARQLQEELSRLDSGKTEEPKEAADRGEGTQAELLPKAKAETPQAAAPKAKSGGRIMVKRPDGRLGYIPEEQWDEAEKQGYIKAE